ANNLTAQRQALDNNVTQTVSQINQYAQQIAQLNGQISQLENVGESAGTLVDQRTTLIDQLSSLVDVSVISTGNSLTLTTASGAPLVAEQQSFSLQTESDPSGVLHIYSLGIDITSKIVSGQLGGVLQARDVQIPAIQTQLDTLASGVANAVNSIQ